MDYYSSICTIYIAGRRTSLPSSLSLSLILGIFDSEEGNFLDFLLKYNHQTREKRGKRRRRRGREVMGPTSPLLDEKHQKAKKRREGNLENERGGKGGGGKREKEKEKVEEEKEKGEDLLLE